MKNAVKYFFKKLEAFFLWSSGANIDVLQQVPMEKNKFLGIGGTIIFTALMASFAGGYAFFTAFKQSMEQIKPNGEKIEVILSQSYYLSAFFGVFWGLLIFNLDRFIVSTFGVGDGKKTISKQELIEASPRLIMAIILGFVISTPLELKLFEKEIKVEVENIIRAERDKLDGKEAPLIKTISEKKLEIKQLKLEQNQLLTKAESIPSTKTIFDEKIDLINKEYARLEGIKQSNSLAWSKLNRQYEEELDPTRKEDILRQRNKYSNSENLRKQSDLSKQISALQSQKFDRGLNMINEAQDLKKLNQPKIEALEKEIKNYERQLQDKKASNEELTRQYSGLMARLIGLSNLTDRSGTLLFTKWLITLLFIFIEIAPILFKMMTERGPYDDIIDRMKHEHKVRQMELQSNINQEINTSVKIHIDKHEQKLNAELQSNKELLEAISAAQREIALAAIAEWKEDQKRKVKEDGATIINSASR